MKQKARKKTCKKPQQTIDYFTNEKKNNEDEYKKKNHGHRGKRGIQSQKNKLGRELHVMGKSWDLDPQLGQS